MVALEILLLAQVPPGVASVSVMSVLAHKLSGPVIAEGKAFTVIRYVAAGHPEIVYEMKVVPTLSPETMPVVSTDPTEGALQAHVPPASESNNVILDPTHKLLAPAIAEGKLFTVNTVVAEGHPVRV